MVVAVAPVGQRQVVVDADEVDRRRPPTADRDGRTRRPSRPPAGGRNIRSSRRHRRASSPRPSTRAHIRRETAQRRDERIGAGVGAHASSARAAPSRSGRHRRRRPPRRDWRSAAPSGAATTRPARNSRPRRRRRAKSPAPPCRRRPRSRQPQSLVLSGEPASPGASDSGDRPAPGIGRLLAPAIGVGQPVAGRHVHHDERIERHLEPAVGQVADGAHDRGVGRRAAEGRLAVEGRLTSRARRARQAGGAPTRRASSTVVRSITAGFSVQCAARRSSPNQATTSADALEVRADRLQLVERRPASRSPPRRRGG